MDNDIYRNVDNVNHTSYFDTIVSRYLIESGCLDIGNSDVVGFVVETSCNYFRPLVCSDAAAAGMRVARIGGSGIRYAVGLLRNGEPEIAAAGHFVHVNVDGRSRQSVAVPNAARSALA